MDSGGDTERPETSDPELRAGLIASIEAMSEALKGEKLLQEPSARQPLAEEKTFRRQTIAAAHDAADRFIEAHSFRYRDPSFLRATLEEITKGLATLDTQICEAAQADYAKTTASITTIAGLPLEIVRQQIARAHARFFEQHQHRLSQLDQLVNEFRGWSDRLVEEGVDGTDGIRGR